MHTQRHDARSRLIGCLHPSLHTDKSSFLRPAPTLPLSISHTGDAAAGVQTLPVLIGPHRALQLATCVAASSASISAYWLAVKAASVSASLPASTHLVSAAGLLPVLQSSAALTVGALGAGLVSQAVAVRRSQFLPAAISKAVQGSMGLIGLGTVLLATVAC